MIEETLPIHEQPSVEQPYVLSEADRVRAWRILRLVQAGYNDECAATLACAETVDLHEALELRARGCPSETAVRILL